MKRKILNFIIIINYYIVSISSINFANAQEDQWQIEHDQTNLGIMVNGSGKPDAQVKKQLVWGQAFALFGAFSFVLCNKLTAYDVDLWAAGAVYYTASNIILRNKEKQLSERVIKNYKLEGATEADKQTIRGNQVRNMEEILKVQREAIEIIKKQNQLLKNMRTIYYSSLALLTTLLILAKTPVGEALGISEDSLKCSDSSKEEVAKALKKVTKTISDIYGVMSTINTGFGFLKSFSFLKNYSKNVSLRVAFDELQLEQEKLEHERSELLIMLSNMLNILMPSALASDSPKSTPTYSVKSDKPTDNTSTDNDDPNTDSDTTEQVKTADEETSTWVSGALTKIRDTVLNPYVRLGLYAVMGTVTQFGVSRNDKDIKTYVSKIDYFDKQVQDLKANMAVKEVNEAGATPTPAPTFVPLTITDSSLNGCVKSEKGNTFAYDEACLCKINKSCVDFTKHLAKDTNSDTKNLMNQLNKQFNGDSSLVYDEKKSETLTQLATKAAETSISDLNKLQLSKGEKPLDMKGNINKLLKSSFYNPKDKVASKSSATGATGLNRNDISDLGLDVPDSGGNGRSGIHLKDSDMEEVTLQDIHQAPEDSVFDVISLRYKKTALPLFQDGSSKR